MKNKNHTKVKRLFEKQTFTPCAFHSVSAKTLSVTNKHSRTRPTHKKARLEPAIRDAQKLAQNVFPPWRLPNSLHSFNHNKDRDDVFKLKISMQEQSKTYFPVKGFVILFFDEVNWKTCWKGKYCPLLFINGVFLIYFFTLL